MHQTSETKAKQENTEDEMLRLDNQLCFALYVCSKEVIRRYRPILKPLNLTYTGYVVMMALWEEDEISVSELGKRIYLDSGTLTPLLKKLEKQGYIKRARQKENERTVIISLTDKGKPLKEDAKVVPRQMMDLIGCGSENAKELLASLHEMMRLLGKMPEDM